MNPGADRIRRFSMIVWMLGSLAVATVAFAIFPTIQVNPNTGDVYVGGTGGGYENEWPWFVENPDEYEIVDGQLAGTREGGYLTLPGGDDLVMITAGDPFAAEWVRVYQQLDTERDTEAEGWDPGGFVGSISVGGDLVVMPGSQDGLLWFGESLADWTATVTKPETIRITDTYSGKGNAVLVYEGEALSGRFQHFGSGYFGVAAVTVGGWQSLVNDADDVDVRASWEPTPRVALFVQADTGDGTWTITLDTPAGAATPAPTPTP